MKKHILNVMIIISFLFLLYRFAEATGSYSSIKTEEQQEETPPALAEEQRSIYRKENYNQRKGPVRIIYDIADSMEKEGLYYYIDDENVTKEEPEEWLYQQIWMEMIPIEEWGAVPERISETETMVEYTLDQETDESFYDAYLKKI